MARKYPDLIDDLAIIQGEDYLELVDSAVIKLTGDLSQGTPSGQIRTDYLEDSGTLLANFAFESSVYDGATDETIIKPYLTNTQTSSLAKTSFKTGKTPSLRNCYVYDIEVELNNVKHKLAYGFVQVIGEVTGNGTPAPSPVEVFLTASNNLSELTDPAAARANLEIVNAKPDWNAAPGSDEEILNKPTLGTAAATDATAYATAAQGTTADTALQPGDIGVTVQGYSADTVIDANYVATENSYTTTEKNKLAGIEAGATANDTDANLLNRANHTGTQTAATISNFDTEVSNNTDVAANTSARHDAVTVVDSSEIDFTLTGQQITASIVAGSIDETKLDDSVNASLDLADSALQSQTFNESIVIYLSPLDSDIAATTKAAIIPYLPYNLEVSELVLEVDTAPTGSNIEVNINVDGTSFLTTIISIDATETSSTTATTAYVIDTTTFPNSRIAKESRVTVDIDQVGSTVAGQNLVLVINGVRY